MRTNQRNSFRSAVQQPQQQQQITPSFPPVLVLEKLKGELFSTVQDRSSIKTIQPQVGNGFTDSYEGQIDSTTQKRHGVGVLKWPNGNVYHHAAYQIKLLCGGERKSWMQSIQLLLDFV